MTQQTRLDHGNLIYLPIVDQERKERRRDRLLHRITSLPALARIRKVSSAGPSRTASSLRLDLIPTPLKGAVSCVSLIGEPEHCVKQPSIRLIAINPTAFDLPPELALSIFRYLRPVELIRSSRVCRSWHDFCLDGQLWANFDTADYYQYIPSAALQRLLLRTAPFIKILNLRGCAQLQGQWPLQAQQCRRLERLTLQGCSINRSALHYLIGQNPRLIHIDFSGLADITNSVLRTIARNCPQLERLDVSWCGNVDMRGLLCIVQSCSRLKDLRIGEIGGFGDPSLVLELFTRNTLECLIMPHCIDFDDRALECLVWGEHPRRDLLTDRAMVPRRRLGRLNLTGCSSLSTRGISAMASHVGRLTHLQLSHCSRITDDALLELLPRLPILVHLEIEELPHLTNAALQILAKSPCRPLLEYLNISYCEELGDGGMIPVVRACPRLSTLVMDNTRVSDLLLAEMTRYSHSMNVTIYDCQLITYHGILHILRANASDRSRVIQLKCYYGYQEPVNEHAALLRAGDVGGAISLQRRWTSQMEAAERDRQRGSGLLSRLQRRRWREATTMLADQTTASQASPGTGCIVM